MRLNQHPVFRRVIVPWYDSETVCLLVIFLMFFAFLIGLAGISVAREKVEYYDFAWVPVLIVLLSGCVIITTVIRLIKRNIGRLPK